MKRLQLGGRASPGLPASFFSAFLERYLGWKVVCVGMGATGKLCLGKVLAVLLKLWLAEDAPCALPL